MLNSTSKKYAGLLAACLTLFFGVIEIRAEDPKAEEIIARHLDSIGEKEKRAAVKNLVAIGASEFIVKVPFTKVDGRAVLASDAETGNLLFISNFGLPEYQFEKIGFFGSKVNVPFIRPGTRSPLGSYLLINDKILSSGLFAGSITTSWRFLGAKAAAGDASEKLETAGKKKIDGRETYVLNFISKGGFAGDASVKLYFDAKNFQHLRTEYRQKIPDNRAYAIGIFNAQTGENTNLMVEEFGDFKQAGGLTLPHSYSLSLTVDGRAGTSEFRWNMAVSEYRFNQKLDPAFFSFDK